MTQKGENKHRGAGAVAKQSKPSVTMDDVRQTLGAKRVESVMQLIKDGKVNISQIRGR